MLVSSRVRKSKNNSLIIILLKIEFDICCGAKKLILGAFKADENSLEEES